ncbi:ABC transporter ATP-binding protein [Methylobacterium sp. J-030]|uniref:ABC transporter ATP-binding protein n=1 Tax=Methylobacterium sp. J-030 TaxID=2836627 RepID=UPI001FB8F155|nr:ABC transporter ATP-binding protein [Methylobacterium sp. J-030]MCJ2073368.1 ABC transporter ATP-binding protein [Methylobacterium sp. J-030]
MLAQDIALELKSVTKIYKGSVTVGPIDLAVRQGEFFSLLGPSGCGKSTTLRCIAGFETPTSGSILLGGERLDAKPAHRRDLGLVFQNHALFPHLTVAGNVGFGLALRKVGAGEITRRVARTLELVGLAGCGARMPSQLSGGQQQRVALARSLILEPPLLLLDEPLSSLDLKLRQQMRDELRGLQRTLGQTTVFVTHDQTEALAMSDRIAVLSNGRIEQVGTPREIYGAPATRFVANFIGESNTLAATVEGIRDEVATLRLPAGQLLRARLPAGTTRRVGEAVWAIVRPENLTIQPAENSQDDPTRLAGTLDTVSYLGEDIHVRLRVPGLDPLLASMKATRRAEVALAVPKIEIGIDACAVVVLAR